MTTTEREQVEKIWGRLICLINIIDPNFDMVSFYENNHMKEKNIVSVLNSIDYLQLSIKYLKLDIEATRREKGHLLKIIQSNNESEGISDE